MLERTRSRPGKTATHLPRLMEAAAIDRFGEPEVLTIHALPVAKLKVPIAEAYALERAAKGHARFAEGHVLGKIVLRVHHP